jgi:hypothetical protein
MSHALGVVLCLSAELLRLLQALLVHVQQT